MKTRKSLLVATSAIIIASATALADCCVPMRPDSSSLRSRFDAIRSTDSEFGVGKSISMDKVAETQLSVIDILIGLDQSAVAWLADNKPGMSTTAYAQSCIDKLNRNLSSSNISEFRYRLSGVEEIQEDLSMLNVAPSYLHNIVRSFVGADGTVAATGARRVLTNRREELGADIVTVLVSSPGSPVIGAGYSLEDDWDSSGALAPAQYRYSIHPELIPGFGDWAYNCCDIEAVDSGTTLAHEIGHNMGCGHADTVNPSYIEPGPQLYDFSSGFHFTGVEDVCSYHTIMAYNFDGYGGNYEAAPIFSSPLLSYKGAQVGDESHDNRQTLINTYKYVAQYRVSQLPAEPGSGSDEPTPGDGPVDPGTSDSDADVENHAVFTSKLIVNGVIKNGENVLGLVQFAVSKTDRKNFSKVSGFITELDGKKRTGRAVKCSIRGTTAMAKADVEMMIKGFSQPLCVTITSNGELVNGVFGAMSVASIELGSLSTSTPVFKLAKTIESIDNNAVILELLPLSETFTANGNRWVFPRAAGVKMKKDRTTGESYLDVDYGRDGSKTNRSGLKLTYSSKSGTFKGTCTVFALTQSNKLKKYKLSIAGFVIDGKGTGTAIYKRSALSIPVTIE